MEKIRFLGLGTMGGGMARQLVGGAFDFAVYNRSPGPLEPFRALGVRATSNLQEMADGDVLFVCVQNAEAVRGLLLDADGLCPLLHSGQTVVDCSTIGYLDAREIAQELKARGVAYLDAPVSGNREKAADGTLTIMCGGEEPVFEQVRPLLERMGKTILYMGTSGCGQLTKMINNCALDICAASFCELMPLGVKLGLPPEKIGQVLMTASGSSCASKLLIPEVLEGNFEHGFTMDKAYKDLISMAQVTAKYAVPLPTLSGAMQTYQLALQTGRGGAYKGAMIRFYEELLGVECRRGNISSEDEEKDQC